MEATRFFRDDDAGYLDWLVGHPNGYVINTQRGLSAKSARMLHRADCRTISGAKLDANVWTGPYVKVCAAILKDLEDWEAHNPGQPLRSCGVCHPVDDAAPTRSAKRHPIAEYPPREPQCEVRDPVEGLPVVEAWVNDYIRFERRPQWQEDVRTRIRSGCRLLEPLQGEVLHARYFGAKPRNADVENLVLYNIDPSGGFSRNGIRFEHGAGVPLTPDFTKYLFCYRYELAPRSATFADWRQGRRLAAFDWTDLGTFAADKRLAQVWLALSRGHVSVSHSAVESVPFAVKLRLRPPRGHDIRVNAGLVKVVFDGVISAFQASSDPRDLPDVATRLSEYLPAEPEEIKEFLLDRSSAVLGAVPRLVYLRGAGVQWNPADDRCVAGELVAAEPVDRRWAVKGELVEVSRRG